MYEWQRDDVTKEDMLILHRRLTRIESTLYRIETLLCDIYNRDEVKGILDGDGFTYPIDLKIQKSGKLNAEPIKVKKSTKPSRKIEKNLFNYNDDIDEIPF